MAKREGKPLGARSASCYQAPVPLITDCTPVMMHTAAHTSAAAGNITVVDILPAMNINTLPDLLIPHPSLQPACAWLCHADDEAFAAKLEELRVELGYWEGYLQNTQYLAGPSFTLADVYAGVETAAQLLSASVCHDVLL